MLIDPRVTHTPGLEPRRETLTLSAADGFPIAADLHLPPLETDAAVLLAPAMGVQRGFYSGLAAHLASAGLATLSLDYRGIGGSRPRSWAGFDAQLHEWAELDLEAALAFLRKSFPSKRLGWLGHSVGGQLFGLIQRPQIAAALFVGSQSGYFKNWDGTRSLAMAALWRLVIPTLTTLTGRLPMSALGQGEDVPSGVAREWASWGRDPEYIMRYARGREDRAFSSYGGPIRSYAIGDDSYAPPRSIAALLQFYRQAETELVHVEPQSLEVRSIGHFGPFRKSFARSLWAEWTAWLRQRLVPAGA